MPPPSGHRDAPLDALRGLAVLGMVLVNLQGSFTQAFPLLLHAPWHGLTLADLVFPFFLLAVGLAIPLTLDRPGGGPTTIAVLRRAGLLIAIGIVLGWLLRPSLDPDALRLTGVLQRIAIVYLVCVLVARAGPGFWPAVAAAGALLVLHAGLLHLPAPGEVAASLEPGRGLAGWLDRVALPGRAHRGTWDPEGVLSTLSAVATGLMGVAAGRWLAIGGGSSRTVAATALAGVGALLAGLAATSVLPLNKALWTPSYALTTTGLGLLTLVALRLAWPRVGGSAPARGVMVLGRTALTLYVVHMVLIAVLVRDMPGVGRLWDALFSALLGTGLAPGWAALGFAVVASALCCAAIPVLARRGWLLKV